MKALSAQVVLPGEEEVSAEAVERARAGRLGRDYVVLGEMLRVWLVVEGCGAEQLAGLEVFARFEEAQRSGGLQMADTDLADKKPRHLPCPAEGPQQPACPSGWRGLMVTPETAVLWQDIPVLLRAGLAGEALRLVASVKTPPFAAAPRLDDVERLLLRPWYAERRGTGCEAVLGVRLVCLAALEALPQQLVQSHASSQCVALRNTDAALPLLFHRLAVSEGSARYHGPEGVQPVPLGELFGVQIEEEREVLLAPGDVLQAIVRWQPKPQAFVQFTDWEGSFAGRLVATWSTPGVRGRVMSWLDVTWKGPRSNDLLVLCQCPPPVRVREQFAVRVAVNNVSDAALALTLTVGGGPGLLCLDASTVLGTLTARSKTAVALRFVGLAPGLHEVRDVRLTDMQGETHLLLEPWHIQIL